MLRPASFSICGTNDKRSSPVLTNYTGDSFPYAKILVNEFFGGQRVAVTLNRSTSLQKSGGYHRKSSPRPKDNHADLYSSYIGSTSWLNLPRRVPKLWDPGPVRLLHITTPSQGTSLGKYPVASRDTNPPAVICGRLRNTKDFSVV